MSDQRPRPFGTNIHIDAFRPWLSGEKLERSIPGIAARGFDHIRVVGDPVLVSDDGATVSDPQRIVARVVSLCRRHGLTALPLSWNVVSEAAAARFPLIDANGGAYPRGHWGLFNFSHPELREVSIRALEATMAELQKYPDVFQVFQPTLEWQLVAYPPYGWSWESYAGETRRAAPAQVMYDDASLARWTQFLHELPTAWKSAIEGENPEVALGDVTPPDISSASAFSAHRLAWARFRGRLMGDYFADVYARLKPHAEEMKLLIPEVMPLPLIDAGLTLSALGHNPEYWLQSGDIGDLLTVSVYDSVFEITSYPGHLDGALDHPAAMMYFAELARSHDLPLAVTEQGANSYHHTEDGQRYLVMRGALAAASFDIESHSHLLWNDEPSFEGVHEQFYGIARDQHLQMKPAGYEVGRVGWLVSHADTSVRRTAPQVMVVVPRESMDVGLEGWTADGLAGPWTPVCGVTTSSLLADRGCPGSTRAVVFSGRHSVGTAKMFKRAQESASTVVLFAGAAEFGPDDDQQRSESWFALTGLEARPPVIEIGDVEVDWIESAPPAMEGAPMRLGSGVDLRRKDLPAGASQICVVRGTDRVIAYRYQSSIVSALPIGRPFDSIDVDLSNWTRRLLDRGLPPLDLPFDVLEGANLVYHLVGDTLTITNGHAGKGTARVSFNGGADVAVVDVAAGQFSAVQLSASPTVALLSGAGRIVVNDRTVVESDSHVAVMLAGRTVRVEPLHGRDGDQVLEVKANGRELSTHSEQGMDVWTGSVTGSSMSITSVTRRVAEAQALFRSRMTVKPTSETSDWPKRAAYFTARIVEDRADRHTLLVEPTEAWLEWRVEGESSTPLQCNYEWWSADGESTDSATYHLEGHAGRIRISVPTTYPALVRCVLAPGEQNETSVGLVYEAQDSLDMLTTTLPNGLCRTRFLHPRRWEGFDVVRASATLVDGGAERDARLVIGHRGVHTRHLQWSEDWVDHLAAEVSLSSTVEKRA